MSRVIRIGRNSSMVLTLLAGVWIWHGFKSMEPDVFPVVTNFNIENLERIDGNLYISGSMNKTRECEFVSLAVYDVAVRPMRVLDIEYLDTPTTVQSRIAGVQAWGVWKISPSTRNIKLVATHECATGAVKSILWDGAI